MAANTKQHSPANDVRNRIGNRPARNIQGGNRAALSAWIGGSAYGLALYAICGQEILPERREVMSNFIACWKVSIVWVGVCVVIGLLFQFGVL